MKKEGLKKIIKILIIMFIIIIGVVIFYFIITISNKNISPDKIYSNSRNSIFFIEYGCEETISFPDFETSYIYHPEDDTILITTYPKGYATIEPYKYRSFTLNMPIYVGTAFFAKNNLYTSAHIIGNCSELNLNELTSYYFEFLIDYTTADILENLTEKEIKFTELKEISKKIYQELIKNYSSLLSESNISDFLASSIIEYLSMNINASLKQEGVFLIKSIEQMNNPTKTEINKVGEPWPGKDYAILSINESYNNLEFDKSDKLVVGEEVYVIGYPAAAEISEQGKLEPTLTKGIISAIKPSETGEKYYQIDAAVSGGNSGGPVFNKKGKVVGILTAGSPETQGFNFFLPSESIPNFQI